MIPRAIRESPLQICASDEIHPIPRAIRESPLRICASDEIHPMPRADIESAPTGNPVPTGSPLSADPSVGAPKNTITTHKRPCCHLAGTLHKQKTRLEKRRALYWRVVMIYTVGTKPLRLLLRNGPPSPGGYIRDLLRRAGPLWLFLSQGFFAEAKKS